jgi:hypothetical protein
MPWIGFGDLHSLAICRAALYPPAPAFLEYILEGFSTDAVMQRGEERTCLVRVHISAYRPTSIATVGRPYLSVISD